MKQFNNTDFTTLAEAQAYTYQEMADVADVITYLTSIGKYSKLKDIAADSDPTNILRDAADACIDTLLTKQNLMVNDPGIQTMIAGFVSGGVLTQDQADALIALGPTVTPYADKTQADWEEVTGSAETTIPLLPNPARHQLTLNITADAPKKHNIRVEQRLGDDANGWTPWEEVTAFRNVQYKVLSYQTTVPSSPVSRELRAISTYAIGATIPQTVPGEGEAGEGGEA